MTITLKGGWKYHNNKILFIKSKMAKTNEKNEQADKFWRRDLEFFLDYFSLFDRMQWNQVKTEINSLVGCLIVVGIAVECEIFLPKHFSLLWWRRVFHFEMHLTFQQQYEIPFANSLQFTLSVMPNVSIYWCGTHLRFDAERETENTWFILFEICMMDFSFW